ncbi:hypothetical protein Vretimale_5626 [Volvox reticuliferus]|uniref:Beta-glucosidase n=2 Tax=Volvox reticuliferus TaxID=1737510 RepID=A0A8J4G618_9CHLO|nr:hypothetical protein Vretimale_5626 [Volvox reticuliferus]
MSSPPSPSSRGEDQTISYPDVPLQNGMPRPDNASTAKRIELPAERRFLKGAAISVWQNAPDEASQWTAFARRPRSLLERLRGKNKQLAIDTSPDFWNRYYDDINCARQLGSNSLRLSLEWSRVMPNGPGNVDEDAVRRYRDILNRCVEAGLEPMVTLHHFVHPQWFEALGAFEREENIRYFVDWAVMAVRLFRDHGLTLIATFNEPTCAAFTGHIVGVHAPGRRGAVHGAGMVLLHMLRAHSAAYRAIRSEPGGEAVRVGLVHQKIRFEAEGSGAACHAARWTADWLTHCFGWDLVHNYLATGRFVWRLLGRIGVRAHMDVQDGRPPCDWLGINYYTRVVLDWRLRFTCRPGEVLTDMGWPVVPEGLYDAIVHSANLGIPLYVTETGIADGRDDRRAPLIAAYWQQVARAVADGHDVRGFYYWTLCDNYEWHLGYNMKFGLFEWTEAPEHPRANAAAIAATNATRKGAAMAALGAVEDNTDVVERSTELTPLWATVGPSAAATATATIVCVSQPHSPYRQASDIAATAIALVTPVLESEVERAVAEAKAKATNWPGRRLRQGSLELIRRYVATPDELSAAWQSLAETVWPHVPLPEALRRPAALPQGRHAGGCALAAALVPLGKALVVAARGLAAACRRLTRKTRPPAEL